jgi:tripartite-type tricarboxylate transporter receptor subunit TctC
MKETTPMAGPCSGVGAAPSRRQVLAAAGAVALGAWLPAARAQNDFPDKPVRIVVPYSAGTGSDVIARLVAQALGEKSGQSFFVENREGGGSLIGTLAVVKAPPDGYTLLMAANPTVIVPSQSASPAYRPLDDLLPVAKVAVIPLVLVASPALKVGSVRELVAYAKANPGKLSYGSSGPGTISQQEMELFKQAMGLDIPEIPYKSTAQAMTDVIGGTLSLLPAVVPLVAPHVQSGRARALAVLDDQRSTLLPDVPAIGEDAATRGYQPTPVWYGFVAPARTPVAIAQTLAGLIDEAMRSPDMPGKLQVQGARAVSVGMARFATDMKVEYDKAVVLARKAGDHR